MAASVDGLQFHRPLEAQLDTTNPKSQVQYDKRKPELWTQFWNRAQAPFDDAGLLDIVVKGKPNAQDLADIIAHIEFEGTGLGADPIRARREIELQLLADATADSRRAYNMLVPMIIQKDHELVKKMEGFNKRRDAHELFVYLRDDASPHVEKRQKKFRINWACAILMAHKPDENPLPFNGTPSADVLCEWFAALYETYEAIATPARGDADGNDYFSIALPILRRIDELRDFAFHAELAAETPTPMFVDYEGFAKKLRKSFQDF